MYRHAVAASFDRIGTITSINRVKIANYEVITCAAYCLSGTSQRVSANSAIQNADTLNPIIAGTAKQFSLTSQLVVAIVTMDCACAVSTLQCVISNSTK